MIACYEYKLMSHPVFSDTLQSDTESARVNIYGQAYCTSFGQTRLHPIRKKGKAHETLYMVFKRDCFPPCMILDNSKEQPLGEFKRKYSKADCHLVNSEPYLPWKIAAEGCVKDLKKAYSCKLISTG